MEHEKRNLSYYVHHSPDGLMRLVARSFAQYQEDSKNFKKSMISKHLSLLSDKPLHGQFCVKLLTLCPIPHNGLGGGKVISQKNWRVLFVQLRSKLSLPMQLKHTFTTYHALRSVDSVA